MCNLRTKANNHEIKKVKQNSHEAVRGPESGAPVSMNSSPLAHGSFSQQVLRGSKPKKFWHPESFDRIIRDRSDLDKKIKYTLNNPVKAGFVNHWEDWPYSFVTKDYIE